MGSGTYQRSALGEGRSGGDEQIGVAKVSEREFHFAIARERPGNDSRHCSLVVSGLFGSLQLRFETTSGRVRASGSFWDERGFWPVERRLAKRVILVT
jgi:hypothetical protein